MAIVVRTPTANVDLGQIVRYIANDNLQAALAWLDEMEALFQTLAGQPEMGQRCQAPRLGAVRRHVCGNYVIYFRPLTHGVEIVRVLHGARDHDKLL